MQTQAGETVAEQAQRLIDAVEAEGRAVLEAVQTAPEAPVGNCPGWTLGHLLAHVGGAQAWIAANLRQGERVRQRDIPRPPREPAELLAYYRQGLADLLDVMRATEPEAPSWTFGASADGRAVWWFRRAALETAVHRWDAQAAAADTSGAHHVPGDAAGDGTWPQAVDRALAADGVDEYLRDFLPAVAGGEGVEGLHGTLHLHATDGEGEWFVDLDASPIATRQEHAKADTAIRGPVSDLLMWLWNRLPGGGARLEVFGRTDLLVAWQTIRV